MNRRASLALISVLAGSALSGLPAVAQTVDTAATSKESKAPKNVDIEADTMEILDAEKRAVFTGNVNAKRGSVTLKCEKLVVTYTETPQAPTAKQQTGTQTASETQGGANQGGVGQVDKKTEVTFLDAEGSVVIVTSSQTVTGKTAHMDVKANKLWVKGGAKVVQGKTIMNGEQLFVDLNTNKSEMTGGRVKGSFVPEQ
jgi:lipopolysaccharide export system protein LptA